MIFFVIRHATINTPEINIRQLKKKKTMNIAVTWDGNDVCVVACDCKHEVRIQQKDKGFDF